MSERCIVFDGDDLPEGFSRVTPAAQAELRDFAEWLKIPKPKPEFRAWRKARTPATPDPETSHE